MLKNVTKSYKLRCDYGGSTYSQHLRIFCILTKPNYQWSILHCISTYKQIVVVREKSIHCQIGEDASKSKISLHHKINSKCIQIQQCKNYNPINVISWFFVPHHFNNWIHLPKHKLETRARLRMDASTFMSEVFRFMVWSLNDKALVGHVCHTISEWLSCIRMDYDNHSFCHDSNLSISFAIVPMWLNMKEGYFP